MTIALGRALVRRKIPVGNGNGRSRDPPSHTGCGVASQRVALAADRAAQHGSSTS